MKKTLLFIFLASGWAPLQAQQLYLEVFSGINKTAYDYEPFNQSESYAPLGFRLAAGADHVQIGGEYRTSLSNAVFESAISKVEFEESYYGGFIRGKISKYPAMRFGLVLRAGAGFYDTKATYSTPVAEVIEYDPILGFNGGFGFSIPVFKAVMLELGYTYNYLERPEDDNPLNPIPSYKASYHSLQAGLSLNLVFGERAKEYRHLKENWRWRNGWRG